MALSDTTCGLCGVRTDLCNCECKACWTHGRLTETGYCKGCRLIQRHNPDVARSLRRKPPVPDWESDHETWAYENPRD